MMIRKTFAWALLAGLVAGATGAAGAQTGAQTVDELIAKNIQARGGMDKLKAVKSLRMTGRMEMGEAMKAPFTVEMVRPDKMRRDFTVQGRTGTVAFDGQNGWSAMGQDEPEPIPGDDLKPLREEADFDGPLVDYKAKGHQVELAGKEDVDGKPAYKLKVTKKNGDVEYHYLDAERYLEVKVEGTTRSHGQAMEGESALGNYRTVSGVVFPFSVQSRPKNGPGSMTITLEKIEVNPDVPASRFEMPKAAQPTKKPAGPPPPTSDR